MGVCAKKKKLTAELEAIPGEMKTLDREIARAEHLAAKRLVARLGSDLEVTRTRGSVRHSGKRTGGNTTAAG